MSAEPTTPRHLRYAAMSGPDEILLRSMLALLDGQTREHWQLAKGDEQADLVIIGCADAEPVTVTAARRRARLCATVPVRFEHGDLELPQPLRPRSLATLLDNASLALTPPRDAPAFAQATRSGRDQDGNKPTLADLLYSLMQQPPADQDAIVVELDSRALMRIDVARGRVQLDSAADVIHAAARCDAHARAAGRDEHVHLNAQPLTPLLWSVGLAHQHALVAPARAIDSIIARRWPDFGRLPHRGDHLRMTAHLSRQPMSTDQLATVADVPAPVAIGFVNAMLLGGLASLSPANIQQPLAALVQPAPAPVARSALFARIRARLGL